VSGGKPQQISLAQIGYWIGEEPRALLIQLRSMKSLPTHLRNFLVTENFFGCNIKSDMAKLSKDFRDRWWFVGVMAATVLLVSLVDFAALVNPV